MDFRVYPNTVDSHTHVMEMKKKDLDIDSILSGSFESGMAYVLDVAVNENNFEERLKYKEKYPRILLSAGVHPNATTDISSQIEEIDKQLKHKDVIAVGETGLDFHWDTVPADLQKEMFAAHIELSKRHGLPLIVHNRLADKELLEVLKLEKAERGVIHCFSSDYHFAKKFVDLGFYISFAGNITYKKSEDIREAAAQIPLDRILVETDAPYLAPQKKRGKVNHPGNIGYTIDCIADIFNMGADETANQTYLNFIALFQPDNQGD